MALVALVLLAAWALAYVVSGRRAQGGHRTAPRWNLALLVATLLASLATCTAPVVPLVSGFSSVANTPPAEKSAELEQVLDRTRTVMALALLSIPLVALGISRHAKNRRRIEAAREAEKDRAASA